MQWKTAFCLILLLMSMIHCGKDPDGIAVDEEITDEDQENQEKQDEQPPEQDSTNSEEDDEGQEVHKTLPATALFPTAPTTTLDYCHCDMEIYGLKDLEGVLKSPNYPGAYCDTGKCIYKILPHPDMTLRISINDVKLSLFTSLKIWTILNVDGGEYNLFYSEIGTHIRWFDDFSGYDSFTTAKNVGIRVVFEMQKNTDLGSGFKMTFERLDEVSPKELCPTAHVFVGHHFTVVSESKLFSLAAGCSFYLSPARYEKSKKPGEMVIEVNNPGDAYVSFRSYDKRGSLEEISFTNEIRTELVDASRVEIFFRRYSSLKGDYLTPKIVAKLVNQSCTCPPSIINLAVGNLTVVRSPGFPFHQCPERHCMVDLIVESGIEGPRDTEKLIHVMTKSIVAIDDYVRLSSTEIGTVIFRNRRKDPYGIRHEDHAYIFRPLMLRMQNLTIEYEPSDKLPYRLFEMNFTVFEVPKKCVCSMFNDKAYRNGGSISVAISQDCPSFYCHWKLSAKRGFFRFLSVEFVVEHPMDSDAVYLFSDKITEQVQGEMLKLKTGIMSRISPIEFTFSRLLLNQTALQDAVLNVTWKTIVECDCGPKEYFLQFGESVAITSPLYPETYCPNLACQHVFYAPEGGYLELCVDDLYLEKYRDFLNVYDGNGTVDPLIARISGTSTNSSYNSTDRTMFLNFITDGYECNKGYHANIYAHRNESVPAPIKTHWIVSFCIVAVIAVVAVGAVLAFFHKKKEQTTKLKDLMKTDSEPNENNLSTPTTDIPLQDDVIFRDPFQN
ncbi:unnamed protein product [Caenorhabditis brenneri]